MTKLSINQLRQIISELRLVKCVIGELSHDDSVILTTCEMLLDNKLSVTQ